MRNFLLTALGALTLVACQKDETPPVPVSRTMLIYMSANNSLHSNGDFDGSNMADIKSAVEKGALNGGRIVILWRQYPLGGAANLIEVYRDKSGRAQERVLKQYGTNQNASDAQFLSRVIADVKVLAPADRYCLDMWSHALGWIPAEASKGRSFGDDNGRKMNVNDMADAIPAGMFDFILFDCCFMGNIETLYELRGKTKYVIASPTEIVGEGMPYGKVLPIIFEKKEPDLAQVCQKYYDEESIYRVVSLYDMTKIDAVASAYKALTSAYSGNISQISVAGVQRFDRAGSTGTPTYWAYDMVDLSKKLGGNTAALETAISNFVPCKLFRTSGFVTINANTYCGVSMSLPLADYDTRNLTWNDFYRTLDWYTATYN